MKSLLLVKGVCSGFLTSAFVNDANNNQAMSFLAEVIAATPNGVLPLQHRMILAPSIQWNMPMSNSDCRRPST
jgi:hypothetical protein